MDKLNQNLLHGAKLQKLKSGNQAESTKLVDLEAARDKLEGQLKIKQELSVADSTTHLDC